MSRLAPLSNGQRLNLQQLLELGVPMAQARAIVQAYGVRKAEPPSLSPAYLAAYHGAAKAMLPDWQHAMVHAQARAKAGGLESGKVRASDDDKRRRALLEIQSLKQKLRTLEQSVHKDGPLSSEVHVPGTDGNILGFRPPNKQVVVKEGDFDEGKHPRAENGEFSSGSGSGGGSSSGGGDSGGGGAAAGKKLGETKRNKPVYADRPASDVAYESFSSTDHLNAKLLHDTAAFHANQAGDPELSDKHRELARQHLKAMATATPEKDSEWPSPLQVEGGKITGAQQTALRAYVNGDDDSGTFVNYATMNKTLQGQQTKGSAASMAHAKNLQKAVAGQTLAQDATLYRGVNAPVDVQVGQTIQSPGFTSASQRKQIAEQFARGEWSDEAGKAQTVMTIKAPKGTHALAVDAHIKDGQGEDEMEHIFGANQRFKVVASQMKGDVHHIELEAIAEPLAALKTAKPKNKQVANALSPITKSAQRPGASAVRKLDAFNLTAADLAYIKAAYSLQAPSESPVPDAPAVPPELEGLLQSNRLVAGMDVEMAAGATDAETARRRASRALLERPGFYDGVGAASPVRALRGLLLDIGCGPNRQPGYLGLDLYPTDYGTVRHDVKTGLPFPDGSVRAIRLCNALHPIIDSPGGGGDPLPLLTECQRVLMEGGRLYYTGPEPLVEPDQRWPLPGLVLAPQVDKNPVGLAQQGGSVAQELMRVPLRVPAYHGADPDFSPAGPLPLDVQMALAAYNASSADRAMADMLNPGLALPTLHTGGRTTPSLPGALADRVNKAVAHKAVPILKAAAQKQIVYGVVLAPDEVDSQGDFMTAEDIETAAHAYLATSRVIGSEHGRPIEASVVESYVAPQQLQFAGQTEPVSQGSWIMGVKIHDQAEWQKALAGGYTGFSVGGFGTREQM